MATPIFDDDDEKETLKDKLAVALSFLIGVKLHNQRISEQLEETINYMRDLQAAFFPEPEEQSGKPMARVLSFRKDE